jgi:stringent starvation protein B
MSEQSAKPYLVRAICEWCADNGLTPYIAVKVDAQTRVPAAYVKNGEIVLNIGTNATRRLTIDNEWVQFNARFAGVSQEVAVPMAAVSGVFAKETGYGFAFARAPENAAAPAATPSTRNGEAAAPDAKADDRAKSRPSHLQVIK